MKKLALCMFVSAMLALTACGGRTANPVMAVQYGDERKSCRALEFEIHQVEGEMQRLLPQRDKTGKNVALGVAGWFLLVPWFFMDFKGAEQQEYEAYRQRYNHLTIIAMDKRCGVKSGDYPSLEQMKQQYQKAQKQQQE